MTGWIDKGLNEKAYIIPGLGDFGERRYVRKAGFWACLSSGYLADTVYEATSTVCVVLRGRTVGLVLMSLSVSLSIRAVRGHPNINRLRL